VAEGAYIVRTRSQLADVSQRLEALSSERESALSGMGRGFGNETGPTRDLGLDEADSPEPRGRRLPPPRLVPVAYALDAENPARGSLELARVSLLWLLCVEPVAMASHEAGVAYLRELAASGARLHGASDPAFETVNVLREG
jgi:hypothetical protein